MTAEIIAVGTELLLGDIVNTNAQYLASELALMGFGVLHQSVVGDNRGRLAEAVRQALSRSDILITTGGLGPTGDDITRETVAFMLGIELVLDEDSLGSMVEFFKKSGHVMSENNKKQVMLPRGCTVLKNDWGTAPGCVIEKEGRIIIMLPGPPREMKPIFEHRVKPYLEKYRNGAIESINLRVFGVPESKVEEILFDLMQGSNPTLSPYAKDGEVLLRVTARGETSETALEMCRPIAEEIKNRLNDYVYGENVDSLQQVVVEKLSNNGLKIGLAESCTGGLLAKRLTEINGSSEVFDCGVVSYANKIKHVILGVHEETLNQFGAVSINTAVEMAIGARKISGADIGVGITGIAGPGGGTDEKPVGLVYIAVCNGKIYYVKQLVLGHGKARHEQIGARTEHGADDGERELIRYLAASNALDMVRRLIDGLPQTDKDSDAALEAMKIDEFESKQKYKKPLFRRIIENFVPLKGDSKHDIIGKIMLIISLAIIVTGFCLFIPYYYQSYVNSQENILIAKMHSSIAVSKASESAVSASSASSDVQILPEFQTLLAQNKEIKGWISIPGAGINLPVVQTDNNSKYLDTDFEGNKNRDGTLFLDYRDLINPFSQDLIIYGHNMNDGQMFNGLEKYASNGKNDFLNFYNANPLITFNTIYEQDQWKIFAVFVTTGNSSYPGSLYYLNTTFSSDDDFNTFINNVRQRSFINTSVDVVPNDTLLTLSTCNYDYPSTDNDWARLVVIARRVRAGESTAVQPATVNQHVVYPEVWIKDWTSSK